MEIFTRNASVRERVKVWRQAGHRIALVPTAGTVHQGHMSLIAEAQERAERVIVSAFARVRERDAPTQRADRDLLQNIGADLLFTPPIHEIYPFGPELSATVDVPQLARVFEGAHRPGHIEAGLTLLLKLINIVNPDCAVFGERDYQQLVGVRQMVNDLFLPVEILECQTLREGDGLAFGSANRLLSVEQRVVAPQLYGTLKQFAARIDAGERDYLALERAGLEALTAAGFAPEYFAIRQAVDLAPVHTPTRDLVIIVAAQLGSVRLIDNLRMRLIDRH
jgi:pantoate--beta-alanine ligase